MGGRAGGGCGPVSQEHWPGLEYECSNSVMHCCVGLDHSVVAVNKKLKISAISTM